MKIADLRIKIQRQAEKLTAFHKKVKEDKKKYIRILSGKNMIIVRYKAERDDARKQLRSACLKKDEKHELIIDLQRSLLKVTDQREDEKAKGIISEVSYLSEIKKLNEHIDSLAPKRQSMLKTSAISKIIKNTGDKDGKELQKTRIPR